MLRRDSKDIVDIVTYDDLLARLQAVLDQLRIGPAISLAPATRQAESRLESHGLPEGRYAS